MINLMKNSFLKILIFLFALIRVNQSQNISGNLIDENENGLNEVEVSLYINSNVYSTKTKNNGSFSFSLTQIKEHNLPVGYNISNNYPNPFNPKTRIGITVPKRSSIKIEIFNILGERVLPNIENIINEGTNYVDLEFDGLSNGIYFANISIDNQHNVTRKMVLLYGSQHLDLSQNMNIDKLNKFPSDDNLTLNWQLDSIVFKSKIIGKYIFSNFDEFTAETINLGNFQIPRFCEDAPTVFYDGRTYNTVKIGEQCWLKENINVGKFVVSEIHVDHQTDNNIIEKYCYNNDSTNCNIYGGLYQWSELMQYTDSNGAQGICPDGWYIPTISDFNRLLEIVDSNGNALKSLGVGVEEGAGNNISGFSLLLSGINFLPENFYMGLNSYTYLYSSTKEIGAPNSVRLHLSKFDNSAQINYLNGDTYISTARCIKGSYIVDNYPPESPNNPSPSNLSSNVPINNTILQWNCTDPDGDNLTYDVYLGRYHDPNLVKSNLSEASYETGELLPGSQYFWRIVAKDSKGLSTSSDTWKFKTEGESPAMNIPCPDLPFVVYEGKTYNTVQIGYQCWLKENLDIGEFISGYASNNGIIEKKCWNANPDNCEIYGGLYNWSEAMNYSTNAGNKGICPDGWHIPTVEELFILEVQVNGNANSLKAVGQGTGIGVGNNSSGFSALIANLGTNYWSSTEYDNYYSHQMSLSDDSNTIRIYALPDDRNHSIRCIRD